MSGDDYVDAVVIAIGEASPFPIVIFCELVDQAISLDLSSNESSGGLSEA